MPTDTPTTPSAGPGESLTGPNTRYHITWSIDLDACSPEDAAQQALAIHRDPASIATVFDVCTTDPHPTRQRINLTERDTVGTGAATASPTDTEYRQAAQRLYADSGDVQIDEQATVSRGEDDGAYVQAWVWTPRDAVSPHTGVACAHCERIITTIDAAQSTFCGSMHTHCMTAHSEQCDACRNEFC